MVASGNATIIQSTRNKMGIAGLLRLNLKIENVKKYFHEALKGVKVWDM